MTVLRLACLTLSALVITGCTIPAQPEVSPEETVQAEETISETSETSEEEEEEEEAGEYVEICVKKATEVRAVYRKCDDAEAGFAWYFLPYDIAAPATGKKATGGSYKEPAGLVARVPATGGAGSKVALTDEAERVQVCVLTSTRVRVANVWCDDEEKGYAWYYIRIDGYAPAVGKKAEEGSYRVPPGETYRVRRNGGDGVDAAIDYESVEAEEEE